MVMGMTIEAMNTVSLDRGELQELGELGTLMAMGPQILDHFRKTQAQKLSAIEAEILAIPTPPWRQVYRDQVLRIVRRHLVNGNGSR